MTSSRPELQGLIERVAAYQKFADDFAQANGGMRLGDMDLAMECLAVLLKALLARENSHV